MFFSQSQCFRNFSDSCRKMFIMLSEGVSSISIGGIRVAWDIVVLTWLTGVKKLQSPFKELSHLLPALLFLAGGPGNTISFFCREVSFSGGCRDTGVGRGGG